MWNQPKQVQEKKKSNQKTEIDFTLSSQAVEKC